MSLKHVCVNNRKLKHLPITIFSLLPCKRNHRKGVVKMNFKKRCIIVLKPKHKHLIELIAV